MVFGFFKRRKAAPPARPVDPLVAFDAMIEELERQGAALRKSAATLLALHQELEGAVARHEHRRKDIDQRLALARIKEDASAQSVLARDLERELGQRKDSDEALARAQANAELLLEAARDVADRIEALRAERHSVHARLSVDRTVTAALRERAEKFERVLALDAARDEVERAHALADLYRDELPPR